MTVVPVAFLLLAMAGALGDLGAAGASIVGACLLNNLPAALVAVPHLARHGDRVWPVVLGLNMGPALVITGALAGLLWRDTAARVGVRCDAWQFTKLGVRIALPAVVAAGGVQVATNALLRAH
jgi:arsenical pump membrane protein